MIRGDVHEINLPTGGGREQHGRRYAVIVQADDFMGLSTVVICPTSQSALEAGFRPEVQVKGEKTRVLCEMVRAVDASRLGDHACHLSLDEVKELDDALRLVLGLGR